MDKDQIRGTVALIGNTISDPEAAHSIEDRLFVDVLTAIAEGAENPQNLATEALKSCDIDPTRWCA